MVGEVPHRQYGLRLWDAGVKGQAWRAGPGRSFEAQTVESTSGNRIRGVVECQEMFSLFGLYCRYTRVRFLSFFFILSGT